MKRPALLCDTRICGRGRHLLRCAVRDGAVVVETGADVAAISPAIVSGFVEPLGRGYYRATPKGRAFLENLARAD